MPDIEGVPYEATGGKIDQATAQALAARHREAASAGVTAAGEAVAPVQSQVSALSSRVDKTLTDAKAYTDSKVAPLASSASVTAGDQKALSDAKTYTDGKVASLDPLPAGGTAGQVLTKTSAGEVWADPKGEKGDKGDDGADWSKDQQAKVQGYWIVVSPTEPESPTYTTADGTVVPVIWQKPIEKLVPVIPEAPYFDRYALSIQVADLVGVDYYLTGLTKDGAPVDVPDVKIPDGGILKLADVSGKPALPYTANVEARAEPGYLLPNSFTWAYSVADPNAVELVTSDTFTGRTEGSSLVQSSTDAALGGQPRQWSLSWGTTSGAFTVQDSALILTGGRGAVGMADVGVNQRMEFDIVEETLTQDAGGSFYFGLAAATVAGGGWYSALNAQARLVVSGLSYGKMTVRVSGTSGSGQNLPDMASLLGHYVLELYENTFTATLPGMAPVTVPIIRNTSVSNTVGASIVVNSTNSITIDNFKVSKIGF